MGEFSYLSQFYSCWYRRSFSFVVGLSVITEAALVTKNQAGWIAVIGAASLGISNRLKCEEHQAECRKLINQFEELQTYYESLKLEENEEEKKKQLLVLEQKLSKIRSEQAAFSSGRSIKKANEEIGPKAS